MNRIALLLPILAGCAGSPPVAPPPAAEVETVTIPQHLQTCPGPVRAPEPPPAPRTIAQIVQWAKAVDRARAQTEAARRVCASRLGQLNRLVTDE